MNTGLCSTCLPLAFFQHVIEPSHCHGASDRPPLPGVLGGFRCGCECNKPTETTTTEEAK